MAGISVQGNVPVAPLHQTGGTGGSGGSGGTTKKKKCCNKIRNFCKRVFEKIGSVFKQTSEVKADFNNFSLIGRGFCYASETVAAIRKTGPVTHKAYETLAHNLNTYDAIGLIGTVSYFGGGNFGNDRKKFKKNWASIFGQFTIGVANVTGVMLFLSKHGVLKLGSIAAKIGQKLPFFSPVLKLPLSSVCLSFVGIAMAFFAIDTGRSIGRFERKKKAAKEAIKKAAEDKSTPAADIANEQAKLKKAKGRYKAAWLKTIGYALDSVSKTVLISALIFSMGAVGTILVPLFGVMGVGFSTAGIVIDNRAKKIAIKKEQ